MTIQGSLYGHVVQCGIDTMCEGVIVHKKFLDYIPNAFIKQSNTRLEFADGSISTPCWDITHVQLEFTDSEGRSLPHYVDAIAADIGNYDIILGLPWQVEHIELLEPARSRVVLKGRNLLTHNSTPSNVQVNLSALVSGIPRSNAQINALDTSPSSRRREFGLPEGTSGPVTSTTHSRIEGERCQLPGPDSGQDGVIARPNPCPPAPLSEPTTERTISVLSTKVRRWWIRHKEPVERRVLLKFVSLMSIRQVHKAVKNKRTIAFLATNIFRLHDDPINDETRMIDFADALANENPIEDITGRPIDDSNPNASRDNTEARISKKFEALDSNLIEQYSVILRKYPKLVPSALPEMKDLQRQIQHHIELTPDAKPKSSPIYHCSEPELKEMKRQITELLAAGHIRHSLSPWASPVIFVKKPNTDKLRMCIDFRHLNKATIKDATPIARIDELSYGYATQKFSRRWT